MAALRRPERRNSNSQLLLELDALSQSLQQSNPTRRTASLALPRSAAANEVLPAAPAANNPLPSVDVAPAPRSRRMSMSPFRTRSKPAKPEEAEEARAAPDRLPAPASGEKKGIWSWKPMRALAHIGMRRLGCLFSVEVVAIQALPASMNGLRLCVSVRKRETKDGAVQTMPARVVQGSADFEETLFIRCHVYCSGKPLKFEPRPFLISAVAIDAPELDFGVSSVDLSSMVKESMERSAEGARIRQWDAAFRLAGKAKGGELVVKLGFQIMDDGGVEIYKQAASSKATTSSSASARRQSKSSFSVSSPKVTRSEPSMTPFKETASMDFLRGIDEFNLDEPSVEQSEPQQKQQDELDLPEFEVIDKGVEVQEEPKPAAAVEEQPTAAPTEPPVSDEVVKEVVHDSAHLMRLAELDEIARQIKELESMVASDETKVEQEDEKQRLDAEEETVTREFLQMLELEDGGGKDLAVPAKEIEAEDEGKCFVSDLGKGLGCVIQTRNGGYLASMNPLNVEVARKETPKLAMQVSKPVVLGDEKLGTTGVEVFQKLAAMGSEDMGAKLAAVVAMDELIGKTAEQIAFEGIASAIISGRQKEGASSSAAKSVAALKTMCSAMSNGREERIQTGLWNVMKEGGVLAEDILPFCLQMIEVAAVEALKIEAEVFNEKPPFEVSHVAGAGSPLDRPLSPEDWAKTSGSAAAVTMLVVVQLRDPLRRFEAVGAPKVALLQAARGDGGEFKVTSVHVGGMKMMSGGKRSGWDGEKQRLTAMQWLVAYGLAKGSKRSKVAAQAAAGPDIVWSVSSRVMADMWLKPMRNPDVKFPE